MTKAYQIPQKLGIIPTEEKLLPKYLLTVAQELEDAIRQLQQSFEDPIHVTLTKKIAGQITWADGSNWDPGDGEGLYQTDGTNWRRLTNWTAAEVLAKLLTVDGTGSGLDADKLDGQEGSYYAPAADYLALAGGQMTGNITMAAAETVDGRDLSVDGTKLDGIESAATADQTAADIRTLGFFDITNDGIGSGLDADKWDGAEFASYLDQAVLTSSTVQLAKLGIGTSSPESPLHVRGAIDDTPSISGVQLGESGNYAVINLFGTSGGFIDFSDSAGADFDARIILNGGILIFRTAATDNMLILTGSDVKMGGLAGSGRRYVEVDANGVLAATISAP